MLALCIWLLVLAALGILLWKLRRPVVGWVAAMGWLSLPLYNAMVLARCTGDCSIRVDLLIVAPVLIVLTGLWVVGRLKRRRG